jgi:hypothetical protein
MTKMVIKSDTAEQRMVYGELYAPDRPDAQGEFMRADTIQKMAYDFVREGRMKQIDVMHDNQVVEGPCIVESFIARKGDPDFIEGAWVLGMHVPNDDLWDRIKKGELNGFSLEALVTRHDQDVDVQVPAVVSGLTSKSEDHTHEFFVSYDNQHVFKGGTTNMVNGHQHRIVAGTHTEMAAGHSHRFSSVDDMKIL